MKHLFKLEVTDSISDARRKIVNILTLGQILIAAVALIVTVAFDVTGATQWWPSADEIKILYVSIAFILISMPLLFLLNQRFSTLASWLLVLLLCGEAMFSDVPERLVERGLILFVLPIMAASAILPSWTSFVIAGLGSFGIAIVETLFVGRPYPNFAAILVLFAVAFISYLSNASKESILGFVRKANTQLSTKLEAQQQNLLQIVNDFAFLADNQENVVMLYGPDKKLVFANQVAARANEHMSEEDRSAYFAVVERAWEKNVATRLITDKFKADIVSSLIDTDSGTYLLIQAVRLPDEESKRSLDEWQRKLMAANNLPEGAEYDMRTRKMRATRWDGKNFSKKVIFELDTDASLVVENPLNRRQKFRFDLKDLWILAIWG